MISCLSSVAKQLESELPIYPHYTAVVSFLSFFLCLPLNPCTYTAILSYLPYSVIRVDRAVRIGVLGSTSGTDLQFLYDRIAEGSLKASIEVVISNRRSAYILERAKHHRSHARFCSAKGLSRTEFDANVSAILHEHKVDLVLLIGYMRIVSAEFCQEWHRRCFNVHPSLLPAFGGGMDGDVHEAVIAAGESISGCTVHLVSADVDGGDIVVAKACTVLPEDTPVQLRSRVQKLEGHALVQAVQAFASGDLKVVPQQKNLTTV